MLLRQDQSGDSTGRLVHLEVLGEVVEPRILSKVAGQDSLS